MQFSKLFYGSDDERAERDGVAVATLVAMIAASPIVVSGDSIAAVTSQGDLPAGFDAVDIAILDWIAAEGRRAGRSIVRM